MSRRAMLLAAATAIGLFALLAAHRRLTTAYRSHVALTASAVPELERAPSAVIVARGGGSEAGAALAADLRAAALRNGALIEAMAPVRDPGGGAALDIVASGSASAVLRLIGTIEARVPLARMPRFRLATTASGRSLRLDATVVVPRVRP